MTPRYPADRIGCVGIPELAQEASINPAILKLAVNYQVGDVADLLDLAIDKSSLCAPVTDRDDLSAGPVFGW